MVLARGVWLPPKPGPEYSVPDGFAMLCIFGSFGMLVAAVKLKMSMVRDGSVGGRTLSELAHAWVQLCRGDKHALML